MNKLASFRYWFEAIPGEPNLLFWKIVFAGAGAALVLGIVGAVLTRRYKSDGIRRKVWYKLSVWGFSFSLVVAVLGFFRFQNAYLLSMRFFIFAWLAVCAVWLLWIVRYIVLVAPRRRKERAERQAFEQYLPGRR